MKKIILSFIYLLLPQMSFAVNGLGIFGGKGTTQGLQNCVTTGECKIDDIFALANIIANYAMMFTTAVATIMFVYAGFLYITAQGDSGQVSRGTSIFKNVAIGFAIILLSYFLVKEFLIKLGVPYLAKLFT